MRTIIIDFLRLVVDILRLVWLFFKLIGAAMILWICTLVGVLVYGRGSRRTILEKCYEEIDKDEDPDFNLEQRNRAKKLVSRILLCF